LDALLPLAMSDFLDPGSGPDQSGDFEVSPSFFIVLFALGFAIGAIGHILKSRTLVAAGVILVFAATVFIPIALSLSN
jgi:Flp pilus assembly protein TadB